MSCICQPLLVEGTITRSHEARRERATLHPAHDIRCTSPARSKSDKKRKSFVRESRFFIWKHICFLCLMQPLGFFRSGMEGKWKKNEKMERQTKWQFFLLSSKMILQFGVEASSGPDKEEEESNKHESRSKTRPKSNHHSQATFFFFSQGFRGKQVGSAYDSRP
jgi:hypothetical protein